MKESVVKGCRLARLSQVSVLGIVVIVGAALIGWSSTVQACALDGRPTALANGRRAILARDLPTEKTSAVWAPFLFASRYSTRGPILFAEDTAQLARVLPDGMNNHPWRWHFGDGGTNIGWRVRHRYARPGTYRLAVEAYDTSWHQYYEIDSVRITIAQ